MNYAADLHIHSHHSRATSPGCNLRELAAWACIKGIQVIASGDFTHPAWFEALKKELEPAEPGFFRLKDNDLTLSPIPGVSTSVSTTRFILSTEISNIYKLCGKVRKMHNLIYAPDFETAAKLNARLARIGNLASDGRPILGLDSRNLLEMTLEIAPEGFMAPAHIWTPWFSLFGSRSGFDHIEECFGDLSDHIFALETGLSSDPAMNRMISALDRFSLISNSDCHSPAKLGREANLFSTGFDYFSLRDAIRDNNRKTFRGTVEFFPEEGKYYLDGHRQCNVCLLPRKSRMLNGICPICGRSLTLGVFHRVMDLADRSEPLFKHDAPQYFNLIALPEILGELMGVGSSSKKLVPQYARAINLFGSELRLLLETPLEEIDEAAPLLAEALRRVRAGKVIRAPGYDAKFGAIRVFENHELASEKGRRIQLFR